MAVVNAEVRRLISRPNYAHIATLMPDGAPHSVPVWIDLCFRLISSSTN